MVLAFIIPLVTVLGIVPPLSEEQREAIPRWRVDPETIDEPGLYVLLNNAARWPAEVSEQARAERVADLALIRAAPGEWRGEVFVVDGLLRGIMPAAKLTTRGVLAREGWDDLEAWTVELEEGGKAIVLLTDPPQAPRGREADDQRVMNKPFPTVRTVGRFFKTMELEVGIHRDRSAGFPIFVGKTARITGTEERETAGDDDGPSPWAAAALLLLIVGMVGAFMVIRKITAKGPGPLTRRLEEARARHQAELAEEEAAYREDLPEDPVDALGALSEEHTAEEEAAEVELEGGVHEADDEERRGADDAKHSG